MKSDRIKYLEQIVNNPEIHWTKRRRTVKCEVCGHRVFSNPKGGVWIIASHNHPGGGICAGSRLIDGLVNYSRDEVLRRLRNFEASLINAKLLQPSTEKAAETIRNFINETTAEIHRLKQLLASQKDAK